MKFLITSIRQTDGKTLHHIYDNINNQITTEAGIPLCLRTDPRFDRMVSQPISIGDRSRVHPKTRHISKLKIQVGLGCNFNCRYCGQREYDRRYPLIHRKSPDEEVRAFMKRLDTMTDTVNNIMLMGGEPFLYMDRLVLLVKGLRKRYPDARLGIITNGSFLNNKVVDWCLDNRINLIVSHDGSTFTDYRDGHDILDNQSILEGIRHYIDENAMRELGLKFQINVVVTPKNRILCELKPWFTEKIGRDVDLHFESIVKLNQTTCQLVDSFNEDELNELLGEIFNAGINNDLLNPLWDIQRQAINVQRRLVGEVDLRKIRFSCDNVEEDVLSVDLQGNLLFCHAYPVEKTGYGVMEDMGTKACTLFNGWEKRYACRCCPFLVACLGGCAIQDEVNHEISCRTLHIWNMGLFFAAWFRIFGSVIQSISPERTELL